MNDFLWAEEHIILNEHREGWIRFFKNKFNDIHPDKAEWFGLNNLEETISLRRDHRIWYGGDVHEYKLIKETEHPQLTFKSDLTIITFEEYMDYIKIWE